MITGLFSLTFLMKMEGRINLMVEKWFGMIS